MKKTEQKERRFVTDEIITRYKEILTRDEKRKQTIEKYIRDIKKLQKYLAGRELTKECMVGYKTYLEDSGEYAPTSINSFLSAANSFCERMGWYELRVKTIRIQHQAFESEDKELTLKEYEKLIETAWRQGKEKIALIMQTMGSTGIRVSELECVTAESLERGMTVTYNKGKARRIMYPRELVEVLRYYAMKHNIVTGSIFITRNGKQMDRSNVWREMKMLCKEAGVPEEKVFPHNLRHLFARCFYNMKKDIALLSDILGHSNISTTRLYIKSTGKEHQRQLNKMNMVIIRGDKCCKRQR